FFFQAEDGIRDLIVTGVQTCALPICNIQEILDLGRLGFELSRYSGLWVAFKIVTNVADEIGTADVAPDRVTIVPPEFIFEGRPWQAMQQPMLMPPFGLETERQIHYGRLEAVK